MEFSLPWIERSVPEQIIKAPGRFVDGEDFVGNPTHGEPVRRIFYQVELNPHNPKLQKYTRDHKATSPTFSLRFGVLPDDKHLIIVMQQGDQTSVFPVEEIGIDPTLPSAVTLEFNSDPKQQLVKITIPPHKLPSKTAPLQTLSSAT